MHVMERMGGWMRKINGKLGEGFDTFYGVKQGDPLSTD